MRIADVKILVALRMEQAEETLRDGRILLQVEPRATRSAVNRAYYAAFYALLGLLQTIGKTPEKHKGAIALFDTEFVKTGVFPKSSSKSLHDLFQARLEDDYKRLENISLEEAKHAMSLAEEFIKQAQAHLRGKGFWEGPEREQL